jgi:non-ribosomal peptide synthetase component F
MPEIDKKNIEAIFALSPQQKGMLFDSLYASGSGIHVEQKVSILRGISEVSALELAWQRVSDRHSILRTAFAWQTQEEPLQVVLRQVKLPITKQDWRRYGPAEQQSRLKSYLDEDRRRGFDVSRAPLIRLALFRTKEEEYYLLRTHHHVILDGWSGPILESEVLRFYEAFQQGHDLHLGQVRPYRDYIAWLKQQDLAKAESFWRRTLRGITKPTALGIESSPVDIAETAEGYGYYNNRLSSAETMSLKNLLRLNHITLNTLIQGLWALLLSLYSGDKDVVFGTTVAGRPPELDGVEAMIGLFINTLPLRITIAAGPLWEWLDQIQVHHLDLRNYEYCSTGQIHQWTDVPGSLPLYESILVFENYPTDPSSTTTGPTIDTEHHYSIGAQTRYPLNILVGGESELELYVAYDRSRLDGQSIVRLVEHLLTLVKAILADPEQKVRNLLSRIPADQVPRVRPQLTTGKGWQQSEGIAPRNSTEKTLAGIWAEVLGTDRISIRDNFFELRGHSLLATQVLSRVRAAFNVELPLRCLFESPTIAGLAERIEAARGEKSSLDPAPLVPVTRDVELPLSFAQQRLWFLNQLQPDSPFYNVPLAIRMTGPLRLDAFEQAVNTIVARHEALRTVFVAVDDNPCQMVLDPYQVRVCLIDLSHLPENDRESEAAGRLTEEADRPFDLARGPLFRVTLVKLSDADHVLLLNIHHIVCDHWSMAVLFRELGVLYQAFCAGKPSPLPALKIQYADYAVWQRTWLQGEVLEKQLAYWRRHLNGAPPVLELPADRPRPQSQTFRGAKLQQRFPPQLNQALITLSQREGVTLFMTLLAAFQVLVSRYTGREDVVVGTDLANRNRLETENLIGFFVNLLPILTNLSGNPTFTGLLARVREVVLEAYAHQELPFERLVEEMKPERDLSRNPLVQVLFVMQNTPHEVLDLSGLRLSQFELGSEHSRFDLALFVAGDERELQGLWLYNPDLFEEATIARMSARFEVLLHNIVIDPSTRVDALEVLTDAELADKAMEKTERNQSQISRLRAVRRRGVDLSQVRDVRTEYLQPEKLLPLVIKPDADDIDLAEWAGNNREFIEKNLLHHGAMLFRGFSVDSVPEFERFASAICPELFGEYGDLPREELGGKVYGSTPYPADETILFHNESSHLHQWPMLIWFYCVKAAEQGGESPIIDCRRIYELMDPAIREKFERQGLLYIRNFTDSLDVSWQNFFHTRDRSAVEDYCRKASIEFEWKNRNGLRTRQRCPAVVRHPQTGEMVFFNQIQLHHASCLAREVRDSLLSMMKEEDLPRNVYYGDGSRIDDSVMECLGELYKTMSVSFPWQEQDVLMLNNMLVAHSRNPFIGERKIVVALGNLASKEQIGQPKGLE